MLICVAPYPSWTASWKALFFQISHCCSCSELVKLTKLCKGLESDGAHIFFLSFFWIYISVPIRQHKSFLTCFALWTPMSMKQLVLVDVILARAILYNPRHDHTHHGFFSCCSEVPVSSAWRVQADASARHRPQVGSDSFDVAQRELFALVEATDPVCDSDRISSCFLVAPVSMFSICHFSARRSVSAWVFAAV